MEQLSNDTTEAKPEAPDHEAEEASHATASTPAPQYPEWFTTGAYTWSRSGSKKLPLQLDESHLREEFHRGGGKGGQAINKNMSRCDLLHIPTGHVIRCQETRSLDQNRSIARRRMSAILDEMLRGKDSVRGKASEKERKRKANKLKKQKKRARDRDRAKEEEQGAHIIEQSGKATT